MLTMIRRIVIAKKIREKSGRTIADIIKAREVTVEMIAAINDNAEVITAKELPIFLTWKRR